MASVGSCESRGEIGVLTIDSPPVNALGIDVRRAIADGLARFAGDDAISAIILVCGGRTFFAGADITEFGKPIAQPDLHVLNRAIEQSAKPVVAAIHGTALGGGLEVALACHYRIAVRSAQLGLPEVKLGLLPGAGGTQRLPRIVEVEAALDLITGGNPVRATKALELGLIDALADETGLLDDALVFARSVIDKPITLIRDREDKIAAAREQPGIFADFRAKNPQLFRGFKAPGNIVRAIEAAVEMPFEQGLAREWDLFKELEASIESEAQRYFFFAERSTAKVPDVPRDTQAVPVQSVGVIGAGTMGGGITMNFLNAGVPVTLVETSEQALERGLGAIRRNYETSMRKGRLSQAQVDERMGLVTPGLSLDEVAGADLVIEAVFEEMGIKKEIFATLDAIAKPGAILASNTSFLDLDAIAAATTRPESVIGLHFFSPANVMRLLEVVRGEKTSHAVIATAMQLGKRIAKVPVISRVCHGFIANRIMARRMEEADALVLEGVGVEDIDRAIVDYGFAMGPFRMIDLVGLDVIGRDSEERSVARDLVAMGRLGQKKGGGYYDYDEQRRATPSSAAMKAIADFAAFRKIAPSGPQGADDILARLLYPVVNEGARLLEEGIALRASDIDVAAVLGYNWPVYRGGPMFWADTVGLPRIVETLAALEARHGERFAPSALLVEKAASGGSFTRG